MINNRFEHNQERIRAALKQQKKFNNNINANLKLYRLAMHYSQESLARILNITTHSYRHKENRSHGQEFTESEIRILHEVLNIPYSKFFEYIDNERIKEDYDI